MSPDPSGLVDMSDADPTRYSAEYQQVRFLTVNATSLETAHPFFSRQYQEATVEVEEIEEYEDEEVAE